jgi:hypothetical protein
MKKSQLRQIIREEISKVMDDNKLGEAFLGFMSKKEKAEAEKELTDEMIGYGIAVDSPKGKQILARGAFLSYEGEWKETDGKWDYVDPTKITGLNKLGASAGMMTKSGASSGGLKEVRKY